MLEQKEKIPLDARLLSDALIELNISRHKVTIYPKGHPIVEESLVKAFDFLQQLFELRSEITLKVAKDTLIVDDSILDKKHPIYREFALCLNQKNIAYVTLAKGLTRDELYTFHHFMAEDDGEAPPETLQEEFNGCNLLHIKAGFIDYGRFSFEDGKREGEATEKHIWERYVKGLFDGTLGKGTDHGVISEIPPEVFAQLVNETATDGLPEETYDRVITSYVRKSSERTRSGTDLRKLILFINRLRPELKKQFLSSSFKTSPKDNDSLEELLNEIPADEAIELLDTLNTQKITIPEAIKNLLEKLSVLTPEGFEGRTAGDKFIVDDIPLSGEIPTMLSEDDFNSFVTDAYKKEIQALLTFDASKISVDKAIELEAEWNDEAIEKDLNQILLELISSDRKNMITEKNLEQINNLLKDQIEHFIGTGQYDQVLQIFSIVKSHATDGGSPHGNLDVLSPEFTAHLVDSFRIVGGQNREAALMLCGHCGEQIIPPLMDALITEESRRIRKFLLDLIIHLGDKAIPEAVKHLNDERWFVKRNMLCIISESNSPDALPWVRQYANHNNPKIRFPAIKYLLKTDKSFGIEVLRNHLHSGIQERFDMALVIAGAFGVKEMVPDLITMLRKTAKRGSDYDHKIPLVRALGHIGDPRALEILNTLLSYRTFLFKGHLQRLKDEIHIVLKQYPGI